MKKSQNISVYMLTMATIFRACAYMGFYKPGVQALVSYASVTHSVSTLNSLIIQKLLNKFCRETFSISLISSQ